MIRQTVNQGITKFTVFLSSRQKKLKIVVAFSIITLSYFFAFVPVVWSNSTTDTNSFIRIEGSGLLNFHEKWLLKKILLVLLIENV